MQLSTLSLLPSLCWIHAELMECRMQRFWQTSSKVKRVSTFRVSYGGLVGGRALFSLAFSCVSCT